MSERNPTRVSTYRLSATLRTGALGPDDPNPLMGGTVYTDCKDVRDRWRRRLAAQGFHYFFEYNDTRGKCSLYFHGHPGRTPKSQGRRNA